MSKIKIIELYGEIRTDGSCHLISNSFWVDVPPGDWTDASAGAPTDSKGDGS